LKSTVLPSEKADSATPELTQLNTTLGRSFDGEALFEQRISRFNSLFAFGAGAALGVFAVRMRRLEIAAAHHAGVSTSVLLTINRFQHAVWVFLASSVALTATLLVTHYYPADNGTLTGLAARVVGLGALGVLCGVSVTIPTIRERALFAYFKQRD
jgi:hypothetical protein